MTPGPRGTSRRFRVNKAAPCSRPGPCSSFQVNLSCFCLVLTPMKWSLGGAYGLSWKGNESKALIRGHAALQPQARCRDATLHGHHPGGQRGHGTALHEACRGRISQHCQGDPLGKATLPFITTPFSLYITNQSFTTFTSATLTPQHGRCGTTPVLWSSY